MHELWELDIPWEFSPCLSLRATEKVESLTHLSNSGLIQLSQQSYSFVQRVRKVHVTYCADKTHASSPLWSQPAFWMFWYWVQRYSMWSMYFCSLVSIKARTCTLSNLSLLVGWGERRYQSDPLVYLHFICPDTSGLRKLFVSETIT